MAYQNISKSKAVRIGTAAPRRQRSKKEEQEFGLARKEFIICPDCNSAFFDKAWHHSLEEDARHLKKLKGLKPEHLNFPNLSARPSTFGKVLRFKVCPACRMKKDRTFEGELVVSLEKEKLGEKKEVMNVIKNSDEQARAHDPMDRILWIEDKNKEIHIYTSENQLVARIGKKLKSAFKGSTLEIRHSHEEDVMRVYWKY